MAADDEIEQEGGGIEGGGESEAPPESGEKSTAFWGIAFVISAIISLVLAIPILNFLEIVTTQAARWIMGRFCKEEQKTRRILMVIGGVLSVGEVIPIFSDFLPGTLGVVFSFWVFAQIKKRVASIAPVAGAVAAVASKIPAPQAQAIAAGARAVSGVAGALQRGGEPQKIARAATRFSGGGAAGSGMTESFEEGEEPQGEEQPLKIPRPAPGIGEEYGAGAPDGKPRQFIPEEAQGAGTRDNELLKKVAHKATEDSPYENLPEELIKGPLPTQRQEESLILRPRLTVIKGGRKKRKKIKPTELRQAA